MKISLEQRGGSYTLHSYRDGAIRVIPPGATPGDDEKLISISGSCLVSPGRLVPGWMPQRLEELGTEHLQAIRELEPEVLLLGSGDRLRFPRGEQLALLVGLGVGYEVMDTAAACRTYNVLVAEGRRVVAALFTE